MLKNLTTEIKVGLLVLVGTATIVMGSVVVTGWRPGMGDTYTIYVSFSNASGLLVGSPAKVAGIKIGEVREIDLVDGLARTRLEVYRRYTLYSDSTATIKSIGVLGDKYVEVNPGSSALLPLKGGDEIFRVVPGNDLDSMIDSATDILRDVKDITKTLRKSMAQIMDDLTVFTGSLAKDGPAITANLRQILEENKANLKSSVSRLDSTLTNLDSITGKVDRGEGTIGKLVNDEQTVDELNQALAGINSYLGDAYRLKLDIGVETNKLVKQDVYKSYMSIRLQPLKQRYYLIQLVDNPRGKTTTKTVTQSGSTNSTVKETTVTPQMQWSLLIAQRYYDTTVRGGLMENHFGMGISQFFGRSDQLQLGLDFWDLGGEFGPHARVATNWRFFSNAYVVVGYDDFLSKNPQFRDAFFGIGINFNEDSLRPLFGSIPFSSITSP